jgi:demethylmenaquinone methyltransferase/2-methoxy-6-polyprenyl-1,4-benzoquinol methylase
VLEVAAGTGYWTEHIARSARSITATDVNKKAMRQIRQRSIPDSVQVLAVDAYSLKTLGLMFNGAFAGLWLSHVPIERLGEFFASLHACLDPGALVVLMDNTTAQCERLPISHTDLAGNTYQDRSTDAGKRYRVLKNFPTEPKLLAQVEDCSSDHRFIAREHFWLFQYRLD